MYIAVIGGGASGLCALRYIKENGNLRCVLFEQNDSVGGTWIYTDYVGKNEHGLPVHSSVHKNIRTNLPKEAMAFPDLSFKECEESYVSRDVIVDYLNDYTNKHDLRSHIKFNHHVKQVSKNNKKWDVTVISLMKKEERTYKFDAVFVCTGHNNVGDFPSINGMEKFSGRQLHSHDYKDPLHYDNNRVLVIGGGPSALDIVSDLMYVAEKVIWSHHSTSGDTSIFTGVDQRSDVKSINGSTIEFIDGTKATDVETIIYCTGYKYMYPFLDDSCEISVEGNYVSPLYKYIVNIKHPTMYFIGIPKLAPQFPMFDLQVRYSLKLFLNGAPSEEYMMNSLKEFEEEKRKLNKPTRKFQVLENESQRAYLESLVMEAEIEPIPDILLKIHHYSVKLIFEDFLNFRKNIFKVINENEFKVITPDE